MCSFLKKEVAEHRNGYETKKRNSPKNAFLGEKSIYTIDKNLLGLVREQNYKGNMLM